MFEFIDRILESRRLKSFDDLNALERATILQWARIDSTRDITIDDLKKFIQPEIERAHGELRRFENDPKKQVFYQAYASLLTHIHRIITTPAAQREQLRGYLKQIGIDMDT
jgi:hypothetical protein